MINFIHKLKHLPEKYMMNSVLENFTILQVCVCRCVCAGMGEQMCVCAQMWEGRCVCAGVGEGGKAGVGGQVCVCTDVGRQVCLWGQMCVQV